MGKEHDMATNPKVFKGVKELRKKSMKTTTGVGARILQAKTQSSYIWVQNDACIKKTTDKPYTTQLRSKENDMANPKATKGVKELGKKSMKTTKGGGIKVP